MTRSIPRVGEFVTVRSEMIHDLVDDMFYDELHAEAEAIIYMHDNGLAAKVTHVSSPSVFVEIVGEEIELFIGEVKIVDSPIRRF